MSITPVQAANSWTAAPKRSAEVKEEDKNAIQTGRDTVSIGSGTTDKKVTYAPPKKLGSDQIQAIREGLTRQQNDMLQAMAGNAINQANSWLNSLGKQGKLSAEDVERFKLPPLATDPAGAAAAIAPGGAYSVDAVATRIFDMAKAMAGDDPAMLEKMRDAVEKGFKAAGVDFKAATGQGLPDISSQTYDEVMKRFDQRAAELAGKQ